MKIMIVIGSARKKRMADTVASWVEKALRTQQDIEVDVADLRDIDLPFYNADITPSAANGQYENPTAMAWVKRVTEADGFIFIVAEYNHGYTAILKNAIDWVAQGWYHKPVSFVSYGGISGGIRAVEQLRQVVLELRMYPQHDAVYIPFVSAAFDENGELKNPALNDSLERLFNELRAWAKHFTRDS